MRRSPTPRPWRPDFGGTTGVSLSSPSYLVRNPNQALHLEKTHKTPRHREMRAFFPVWPREQSRVLSPNSTGGLTPFRPLSGLQEISVATREESGVICFPSRRGLTPRVSLECNPEIPVAPGEKNSVLDTNLDELYFALQ